MLNELQCTLLIVTEVYRGYVLPPGHNRLLQNQLKS